MFVRWSNGSKASSSLKVECEEAAGSQLPAVSTSPFSLLSTEAKVIEIIVSSAPTDVTSSTLMTGREREKCGRQGVGSGGMEMSGISTVDRPALEKVIVAALSESAINLYYIRQR